jgi:hypothetical protein
VVALLSGVARGGDVSACGIVASLCASPCPVLPGRLLSVGFDDQQLTSTTTSPAIASGGSLEV